MIGEPNTPFIEAANHWDGREGQTPRYVILHGTAGFTNASDVATYFANPATQASAHYVIGQDGKVIQTVKEEDAAWANGPISGPPGTSGDGVHHDPWWDSGINPNLLTIAIEHVKPHTDNSDVITPAQQAASFRLVQHVCERWQIPKRAADANGGITGHYSMDPVNRSRCPGPYPWGALWVFLKGGQPPSKWQVTDAAAEWASTAHLFTGSAPPSYITGIAAAWRSHIYRGQRLGPPLTGEYDSADWSGNPIKVQQFTNARCEWRVDGSSCRFFDARGEIT